MPTRRCLTCPAYTTTFSYCGSCLRTKAHDSRQYRVNRAILLRAHIAKHGFTCLGDNNHRAHDCKTLTVDHHLVPVAQGGTHDLNNLRVICGSVNYGRNGGYAREKGGNFSGARVQGRATLPVQGRTPQVWYA